MAQWEKRCGQKLSKRKARLRWKIRLSMFIRSTKVKSRDLGWYWDLNGRGR